MKIDKPAHIFLALGSNIGDREEYFKRAINELREKINIKKQSTWLETAPVGGPDEQGNYLNGVLEGETILSPEELLDFTQQIENNLGRDRNVERWGPRVIDIDILFYDDLILKSERLTIPHKEIQDRFFVLEPLCEIAPDFVHPEIKKSIGEILRDDVELL